jgi:FtsH-binding integral membrane protein
MNSDNSSQAVSGTTLFSKVSVLLTGMMAIGAAGSFVGASITSGILLIVVAIAWLIGTFVVNGMCLAAKVAHDKGLPSASGLATSALVAAAIWTFGSGLVIGPALTMYVHALGAATVGMAFLGTAGVMAVCGLVGMFSGRNFMRLSGILGILLWGLIIVGLVGIFVTFSPMANLIMGGIGCLVFSGYFLVYFQFVKERAGDSNDWPTATICSMMLYLTFVNLLMEILKVLKAINDMRDKR